MDVCKTRVNKAFVRRAGAFGIGFEYLVPLVLSLIIGFLIALVFSLGYHWLAVHTAWPFLGWVIAVGQNPGRFISKLSRVPQWRRGRPKRKNNLDKTLI